MTVRRISAITTVLEDPLDVTTVLHPFGVAQNGSYMTKVTAPELVDLDEVTSSGVDAFSGVDALDLEEIGRRLGGTFEHRPLQLVEVVKAIEKGARSGEAALALFDYFAEVFVEELATSEDMYLTEILRVYLDDKKAKLDDQKMADQKK